MSLYPSAPDIFVNRTGADAIASSDPNNAYDAIEAIEGFIGSSGAAQSNNATLMDAFLDTYTGGRCYLKDADEIYVGPFKGIIANAAGSIKKFRVISTVSTLTDANIDTGAFTAATYYYIYATADAASTEPVFTISASPVAPTGYTFYRRLGWFYNESNAVINILDNKISTFIGGDNDCQSLYFERTAAGTGYTTMPYTDNIPQITQGVEFMSYPFIPSSPLTRVYIQTLSHLSQLSGTVDISSAIFKGSTADAIASCAWNQANVEVHPTPLDVQIALASTAPLFFKCRSGVGDTSGIAINGEATRIHGGAMRSYIKITEFKP